MITIAASGAALGLAAGLSPGPLLSMVVFASVRGGAISGCRVALSPLITDLPVVAISLTLVSALPTGATAALSMAGGLVIIGFGFLAVRDARRDFGRAQGTTARPASLWQGALVNMVSPHPWLFWIGVGAPSVVTAWRDSPADAMAFVTGFYALLVGSKSAVALTVGMIRGSLDQRVLRVAAFGAGLLMVAFGVVLLCNGIRGG